MAVTAHALDRARDRFGIDLTTAEQRELVHQAVRGHGLMAGRDQTATFWLVEIRGVLMKAVVKGESVTTLMPPRWTSREARHTAHAPLKPKQRGRIARGRKRRDKRRPDPITESFEQG
jgi:hypothetical protein